MTKSDVATAYNVQMDVRSSGLVHSAETDILRLQQILREGYASGFTIFKELLQNAEDAGARRMVVAGHRGFVEAANPPRRKICVVSPNEFRVYRDEEGNTHAMDERIINVSKEDIE